jgi:plastocyanin
MKNSSIILLSIIAVILIFGGIYVFLGQPKAFVPSITPMPTSQEKVSPEASKPEEPASEKTTIIMENTAFIPDSITVSSGDTVVWKNQNPFIHTITGFGVDEQIEPGESFEHIFTQPGIYNYECTIHPGMEGVVEVI